MAAIEAAPTPGFDPCTDLVLLILPGYFSSASMKSRGRGGASMMGMSTMMWRIYLMAMMVGNASMVGGRMSGRQAAMAMQGAAALSQDSLARTWCLEQCRGEAGAGGSVPPPLVKSSLSPLRFIVTVRPRGGAEEEESSSSNYFGIGLPSRPGALVCVKTPQLPCRSQDSSMRPGWRR